MEKLIAFGIIFIFIGILLIITSIIGNLFLIGKKVENGKTEIAFGGFIGPIPFGFFTSKQAFLLGVFILIFGIVLWILLKNL